MNMKLSESTVNLLKNFSTINQSILFKEGNKLRSISVMKNILAEATIAEEFPKDFGIYDLNQFLNGLSLHNSPELDFNNEQFVMIREGKMRSKYFFADANVIVSPPEKEITLPTEDVCFQLTSQQLEKLKKAASVYQLPDISAIGENGVVKLVEIIDAKVTSKLFIDSCFCENVLHHTNGAKFVTLLEKDGLIDRRKVLKKRKGRVRQFHRITNFHH